VPETGNSFKRQPLSAFNPKSAELNAMLAKDSLKFPFVAFLDINNRFVDANGVCKPNLFNGGSVHPNAADYKVWQSALEPLLGN